MGAVHTRNKVVSDAPMVTGTSSGDAETKLEVAVAQRILFAARLDQNPKKMPVIPYLASRTHHQRVVEIIPSILWPRPRGNDRGVNRIRPGECAALANARPASYIVAL